jgi:hypothetical protein
VIGDDGSFSLSLHFHEEQLPGTVTGPHRVTVIPPMTESQNKIPVTLRQLYTVEAKENHFDITLPAR